MIRANPSRTDPFSKSVELLRELHILTLQGEDESEAADQIREAMEAPWRQLSSEQKARLEGLSVDLYSIGETFTSPAVPSDGGAAEIEQAIFSKDWDKALQILRFQRGLRPADVAALRGVAWTELGHPEIAALFFAEAYRLDPRNVDFKANYLRSLVHSERTGEARTQALDRIDDTTDPYEVLLSAEILFDCAQRYRNASDGEAPESEFHRIINLIERGLRLLGEQSLDQSWAKRVCTAYLTVALCYDALGDEQRAGESYEDARNVRSKAGFVLAQEPLPPQVGPASKGFHELLEQARNNLEVEFAPIASSALTNS